MKLEESIVEVKRRWREILPYMLSPAKEKVNGATSYICPKCGHGTHGDGLTFNPKSKDGAGLKCFSCDLSGSVIDVYAYTADRDPKDPAQFVECVKDLAGFIGLTIEDRPELPPGSFKKPEKTEDLIKDPPKAPEPVPNTPGKYEDFLKNAAGAVEGAAEYLEQRGIAQEVYKAKRVGYVDRLYFPAAKTELPAVVFPYNPEYSYFSARSLEGKFFYKPKTEEAGEEPIYNPSALDKDRPCFIVEGALDALAIISAGGNACAIIGTAWRNKIIPELDKRKPAAPLVLCLDNDAPDEKDGKRPGQEAQKELAAELRKRRIRYINARFNYAKYSGPVKDANDLIRSNPEQLRLDVAANERAALDPTGIEAFLFEISTEKYKPIPTGIKKMDIFLKGGFIPQTLVLIGGEAGGGKTILATQIFESLAKSGRRCIYFNLEMSKAQLLARSFSRRIYQSESNYKLTALDILQGYKLTERETELVRKAAEEYRREVGKTLVYNPLPAEAGANLDKIMELLRAEGDKAQRAGVPAPCVALDYLHLLSGQSGEDPKEILKRAVTELKEYAIQYDTIALAIMATSRDANRRKGARLDAGRDTSALEYSGDLIIQLKRDTETDADNETHLCITKSRFTAANMSGQKCRIHGGQSFLEIVDENAEKWEAIKAGDPYFD